MDAAGKDSAIKSVFDASIRRAASGFVQGALDARTRPRFHVAQYHQLPERGRIGIFNRSTRRGAVVRVIPRFSPAEDSARTGEKHDLAERFVDIAAFEKYLARNGTVVVKFFLKCRRKNSASAFSTGWRSPRRTGNFPWPMSPSGRCGTSTRQRIRHDRHTSTPAAPWHVCRGSQVVRPRGNRLHHRQRAGQLDLRFPKVDAGSLQEFKRVRRRWRMRGRAGR